MKEFPCKSKNDKDAHCKATAPLKLLLLTSRTCQGCIEKNAGNAPVNALDEILIFVNDVDQPSAGKDPSNLLLATLNTIEFAPLEKEGRDPTNWLLDKSK